MNPEFEVEPTICVNGQDVHVHQYGVIFEEMEHYSEWTRYFIWSFEGVYYLTTANGIETDRQLVLHSVRSWEVIGSQKESLESVFLRGEAITKADIWKVPDTDIDPDDHTEFIAIDDEFDYLDHPVMAGIEAKVGLEPVRNTTLNVTKLIPREALSLLHDEIVSSTSL